jgi:hypothetical protein
VVQNWNAYDVNMDTRKKIYIISSDCLSLVPFYILNNKYDLPQLQPLSNRMGRAKEFIGAA